jgi:5,10-methylene-tetrahydrofolate dehydrogenase/methenyl tetrahydrofolate cyclohydrolase
VPSGAGLRRRWHAFEALAPHVLWAMDICYLYTSKRDGFDRYLITILDDHSRTVIASGLYARQTVAEVVEVGIDLKRDSLTSVMYAEELNSATSSVTLQSTDRHGILGQKPTHFQLSL